MGPFAEGFSHTVGVLEQTDCEKGRQFLPVIASRPEFSEDTETIMEGPRLIFLDPESATPHATDLSKL